MGRGANITLDYRGMFRGIRGYSQRYQEAFQRNVELECAAEIRRASRENFRNRTGRLWRTIRRIPGRGARIGSRYAPYWQYIDNFTRGRGLFVRLLLSPREVRERIVENAIRRTERDMGI